MMKYITNIMMFIMLSQLLIVGLRADDTHLHKNIDTEIGSIIEQFNENTPIIVDSYTTITDIVLTDMQVTFNVHLQGRDYKRLDLQKLQKERKITNLFSACLQNSYYALLKSGFAIEYAYYTQQDTRLFNYQILVEDCAPFFAKDTATLAQYYVTLQAQILPMPIDNETNLVDIQYKNNTIELVYQLINLSQEELDIHTLSQFLETNLITKNCNAPDISVLLEKGFSVKDTFIDTNSKQFYSFETAQNMCTTP